MNRAIADHLIRLVSVRRRLHKGQLDWPLWRDTTQTGCPRGNIIPKCLWETVCGDTLFGLSVVTYKYTHRNFGYFLKKMFKEMLKSRSVCKIIVFYGSVPSYKDMVIRLSARPFVTRLYLINRDRRDEMMFFSCRYKNKNQITEQNKY